MYKSALNPTSGAVLAATPPLLHSADISEHLLSWQMHELGSHGDESHFRSRNAEKIRFIDCAVVPSIGQRRSYQIAKDPAGFFCVIYHRDGQDVWNNDAGSLTMEPGSIATWHTTLPVSFRVYSLVHKMVMLVPDDRIRPYLKDPEANAGRIIRADVGFGGLLTSYMSGLAKHFHAMSDAELTSAGEAAVNLIGHHLSGVGPSHARRPNRTSLFDRISRFIERRLDDTELRPQMIANAHKISLRYLHLLFSDRGTTVSGWIRERRLCGCASDIGNSNTQENITQIAMRWGFNDSAHFSRTFKGRFGVSPKAYRQTRLN